MEDLNATIDELLAGERPDRYDARDKAWRQTVYDKIAPLIPRNEAAQVAAQSLVDAREARATRTTNKVLREIGRTKQWPIDWLDLGDQPLSVGGERVCVRAATAHDLQVWATDERRTAAADFSARNDACEGAEWAAEQMQQQGWTTLADAMAATP
jgi:hypothetical protein